MKVIKADSRKYLKSPEFKELMAQHGGQVQLCLSDMPYNQTFVKGKAAPHDLMTKDDMSQVLFFSTLIRVCGVIYIGSS